MDGEAEPSEMIPTAIVAVSTTICLFAFCMFGENLAEQFDMLDVKLYQCDWFLFPIDIQRMLITLMSNTQQPAAIIGYGNIECTRETFKRVFFSSFNNKYCESFRLIKSIQLSHLQISQKICSYFMALRQITE